MPVKDKMCYVCLTHACSFTFQCGILVFQALAFCNITGEFNLRFPAIYTLAIVQMMKMYIKAGNLPQSLDAQSVV